MIDFDLLFEDVIAARKPLSFEALGRGPEFRSLAISLETMSLRVLGDFANADELLQAVRASAALPRLGGNAPRFRGEPMTDGALLEPIPYETALAEGASHVLVLRSRPAGYRKPAYSGLGNAFGVHDRRELAELIRAGNGIYNRQAARLEHGCRHTSEDAHLFQVAVPENPRGVSRLRADPRAIAEAVRLGARTMATAVLAEPIDLCWQPVVFRTTAGEAAESRALAKLPRRRVATAIGAQTVQ